jgi:hypothetical protein
MEVAASFKATFAQYSSTVFAGGSPWLDLIKKGHLDHVKAESTVHDTVAPVRS